MMEAIDLPLLAAGLAGLAWFVFFAAVIEARFNAESRHDRQADPVHTAGEILARGRKRAERSWLWRCWTALFSLTHLRERLRAAGMTRPRLIFVFAAARLAAPVLFAALAWAALPGHASAGLAFLSAFIGGLLPEAMLSLALRRRQRAIERALPEAIDLFLICLGAGLTVEASLSRIIGPVSALAPALGSELRAMLADLTFSPLRGEAFFRFGLRSGAPALRDFASHLAEANRYGLSVSGALKALASNLRHQAMAEAERHAASLPPKLAVPLVVFFLPALVVLVLAPSLIRFLDGA